MVKQVFRITYVTFGLFWASNQIRARARFGLDFRPVYN